MAGVNTSVAVEGSVIGELAPLDKMSSRLTLRFTATGGKQKPLRFEGGPTSALFSSISGRVAEQTGLAWMGELTSQEPLEIKALP
jgi:hypothetical protein